MFTINRPYVSRRSIFYSNTLFIDTIFLFVNFGFHDRINASRTIITVAGTIMRRRIQRRSSDRFFINETPNRTGLRPPQLHTQV